MVENHNYSEDYTEKHSENLYTCHLSQSTMEKWVNERRNKDKLAKLLKKDGFHLKPHGRSGTIYYIEKGRTAEFDFELSGSNEYDILLFFENSAVWTIPQKIQFTNEEKLKIKADLECWLANKKLRFQF